MSKTILALGVSLLMLGAMIWLLQQTDSRPTRTPAQLASSREPQANSGVKVTLFCAASNRAVMEVIRAEYEELTGRKVDIQHGPVALDQGTRTRTSSDPRMNSYKTQLQPKNRNK